MEKAQRHLGMTSLENTTADEANQHIVETAHYATDFFVDHNKERHDDFPGVALTGVVPDMLDALPQLEQNLSEAKNSAIAFNAAMKTIMRDQTALPPGTLIYAVRGIAKSLDRNPEEIATISSRTRDTIRGIKHKLAAEAVFMNLPENYYCESTPEEDKDGIEYIVTAPNGTEVFIYIKASERAADAAWERESSHRANRDEDMPQRYLIMASGFEAKDFLPGSWNVNYAATQELTPGRKEHVDIATEYTDQNGQAPL